MNRSTFQWPSHVPTLPSGDKSPSRLKMLHALMVGLLMGLFCSDSTAQQPSVVRRGSPEPLVPGFVLNEVLFNSIGTAGSEGSWQWVELFAKHPIHTSGWELQDDSGQTLFSLPTLSLPSNTYVLILLGPSDPELENLNPALGPIRITTGHGFGDLLGAFQGGVRLVHNGSVEDQVYWGLTATQQPFIDLSFVGGMPLHEGDSIGRNSRSVNTGTAADWAVVGGANSNGVTPGTKNEVEIPSTGDMILYGDDLVNSICLGMSASHTESGWLQVVSTSPTLVDWTYSANSAQATAVVHHEFSLLVDGMPVTIGGDVTTTFTRVRTAFSTSEDWHSEGILYSANGAYGLQFESSRMSFGAHSPQVQVDYATDYTWTSNGTNYDASVSGQYLETRTGQDTFSGYDSRSGEDWGGAGIKLGVSSWTRSRLGDGHWRMQSTVQRSWPSLLPKPGFDQSWARGQVETLSETQEYLVHGTGIVSGSVLAFDQFLDGNVFAQLRTGEIGVLNSSLTPTSPDTIDFSFSSLYPLQNGAGDPYDFEVIVQGTTTFFDGKELSLGNGGIRVDGVEFYSVQFAIDPPLIGGKGWWQRVKDFAATTVTCVGGGVAAQSAALSSGGKKAILTMVSKGVAKKFIPIVGWVSVAGCVGKAIGDEVFGSSSGGSGGD